MLSSPSKAVLFVFEALGALAFAARHCLLILILVLLLPGIPLAASQAALVDSWRAWDLAASDDGVNAAAGSVVINEFHYNPSENTLLEEFIELHNPTGSDIDVSGWQLDGAVRFTFPSGTLLPAGQFLVVAQNPPTLLSRYGVAALGPWEGGLASEGEEIRLQDANGDTVDRVDYRAEFPWPVAADGAGASAALVNPALDNDLGSSWRSESPPTPGRTNAVFALNAPPNVRQVNHTPKSPTSTNEIVITAKVTDPDSVASVVLQYQLVTPGAYVPAYLPLSYSQLLAAPNTQPSPNPSYFGETNWTSVAMLDSGTGGDSVAADGVYSITLPAQGNRVLVRYRIRVTDELGNSRQAPFEDDPSLNFACFVYDGVPSYEGTSSADLQTLPVFTLLSRAQDVDQCTAYDISYQIPQFKGQYSHPARHVFNWSGTLVYDGVVYDHVNYRLRGANGRYQPGKRNWRIKFNRGHYLEPRDQFGRKLPRKWSHLTTGKGSNNRLGLTFGLNEVANYLLWNKVGVPAPETLFFHFRVVDGLKEAPDRYGGDFWGLSWAQEDYDGAFLEAHGLEKGNLYKLINASFSSNLAVDMVNQRRYQAAFAVSDGTDGAAIQTGLLSSQTSEWLRARVNCDAWFRYHAVCEAVRHYDFWPQANKNAAWYFSPPYNASNGFFGQFWTLPWDTDSSWGASWNSGQDLVYAGIFNFGSHPDLARDYRNTVREIRDLLFQPDQINPMLDALAARIAPFVPADLARWSNAPTAGGSYRSMASFAGFSTPALTGGVAGQVQDMKEFMFTGGSHSWWIDRQTVTAGGWVTRLDSLASDANIPATPVLHYVGQSNYPMNSLTFECLPFSDPQGSNTFSAMQWRLAEVRNTNQPPEDPRVVPPMEWDAIWETGTLSNWTGRITIPGLVVESNRIYRVRVRHGDNTGRWSHWSAPIEFSVTAVDLVSMLRENLRITEIMYHPPDLGAYASDQLEFLEFQNIGTTPLDVGGLTFTAGITFTFPHETMLNPKQHFLLGRDAGALRARYPRITVDGIYSGKLDNAGETLRLSTPTGIPILEVTYDDLPAWPVTADGMGWSLVLGDPVRGLYRASRTRGGSPAQDDPPSIIPGVVISELLTHPAVSQMDMIEIHNPTESEVDIGGWFLTDDKDVPRKFQVPDGTIIGAGGYLKFNEDQYDAFGMDFGLNHLGDQAYLFAGDAATNLTGYVHGVLFGAAEEGVSFGRIVNSLGLEDFAAMSSLTPGTNNSRPKIGPVVISEIMFQPPQLGGSENYDTEFIELQNVTHTNVPLYSPLYPTNTWKLAGAVNYTFPANTTLPSGGRLLIVSFDPAANPLALASFRATYNVNPETLILGPWSGRLSNDGETVELSFAAPPEPDGFVPYILVERVSYQTVAPWPTSAAGGGHSLQRATLLAYANDPLNWFAGEPSAGALLKSTSDDVDGDGLPDLWEMEQSTDLFKPDGELDPDQDGFNNRSEWIAGTDPWDANSYLRIEAVMSSTDTVQLQFNARPGRSYTVLEAGAIGSAWTPLTNISAASTNRLLSLPRLPAGTHFLRLVTPSQP